MIKQLILLVHFFGLYFYQLFFLTDVTASQQFNATIAPGSETVVSITIRKNDINGFAKIQQELPQGFTAKSLDSKGATFSFKDQKLKLIWMALPSDKEFTVSYKLIADANVTGNYTLGGRFSFIADNERSNIDITPKTITIAKDGDLATNNQNNTDAVINNSIPTIAINANRTIEEISDGKFKITVKITKENVFGFAKITENIPTGFIATMIETQGGIFSFKNNEVKILWMALPSANEFTVVYNLQAQDAINDSYAINGTISYLENNVTKKYEMPSNSFTLNQKEPSFVDVGTNENSNSGNTNDRTNTTTTSNTVTSTPSPETGIAYKVQIAALKAQKSIKYIAKALHVSQKISIEAHEGWSKYIIGTHPKYKNARDARNKIRKNVKRAFVTAYNQGKRITVQEALMISNQKWYK